MNPTAAHEPLLLALDAGTGSVRAVLFDAAGRVVAAAQREYHHPPVPGWPGGQSFDTVHNWELATTCVREAVADSGRGPEAIAAVAASSMREGLVLYDAGGRELWACPNSDSRASEETRELIASGLADRIYALGGDWIAITAPPRLLWLQRHEPELFDRVRHLTMLSDWLAYRLTGVFATDPSIASSSVLVDLSTRTWSGEVAEALGVDPAILPPVHESGTVIGAVTEAAARETGLAPGTPVVAGGADTQLALLGIGATGPGTCTVIGGSFWQTTLLIDQPVVDDRGELRTLCHVAPDQWMIEGIGFWCGLAMRWTRDLLAAGVGGSAGAWEHLNALAADVPPGANGVTAIFSAPMNAKRWVHATPGFLGVDLANPGATGPGALVRSVMEAAAYVVRAHLDALERATGTAVDEVIFSGGAARSPVWTRIIADVTDRVVRTPQVTESTALGAAICAGVGAGIWPDLATGAAEVAAELRSTSPDADARRAYDDLYERWQRIYAHQLSGVEAGLSPAMWAAAGVL